MSKPRLTDLSEVPTFWPDTCHAVSRPLIDALADRVEEGTIMSVGCGSGLLEYLLLQGPFRFLDVRGVEVPSCPIKYLPEDRLLRVSSTRSVHPDAILAAVLMFIYPREVSLVQSYLQECLSCALEKLVWLSHRDDWPAYKPLLEQSFTYVEEVECHGLPSYELLVIASTPRPRPKKPT